MTVLVKFFLEHVRSLPDLLLRQRRMKRERQGCSIGLIAGRILRQVEIPMQGAKHGFTALQPTMSQA